MDILIGILAVIVGAALVVAGLRYFFLLLPIWGFVAGFFVGAALITAVFGDGFLSTTLGIVVGLVFGVLFALISYFYWYFTVILAAAAAGSVLGASIFGAIGIDSSWLIFIIGLAFGVLFAIGAMFLNLPVYLATPDGWMNFWTFNADRGADLGSIWYALSLLSIDIQGVSRMVTALLVTGTIVICLILLLAPRRPRLAQGAFLMVALFLMVNKVYSPQYVLWLLPLLVLARPRWLDWIVFSVAETAYFAAVWGHLDSQLTNGAGQDRLYVLAIVARIGVQLWLCVRVVRDILDPRRDIVRAGGLDDPDGGVLDEAPDAPWMARLLRRPSL